MLEHGGIFMLINRKVLFVKSDVVQFESARCNVISALIIKLIWQLKADDNKAYIVDFK